MIGSTKRRQVAGTVVALSVAAAQLAAQPAPQPAPPQQPATQQAATQQAATQPAGSQPAASQPAATQGATQPAASQPSTKPSDKITVNFKDASLDAVLEHLSASAGFVVMKEGPVDGRVSLMSKTPVTPAEAVSLLAAALKNNGYTAVQDGRVLTIVASAKAKKGSIPVRFGADPEAIEPTQELITQVIPVRNVDAAKLKGELQPLLSTDADVTATTGSNAIVVTDTSANIRRLVNIISGLDRGEGKTYDIRITKLKNANAGAAAKLITAVFKSEPQGMPGQPGMPQMQPGQPPPGGPREGLIPGGGVDQALRGGKVYASADDRTNTLVVTGPLETLKVVDDILKQLDANPAAGYSEIRAFTLKYAEAESTSKMIASLFKPDDNQNNDRYSYFYGGRMGGSDQDQGKVKVTTAFDERTNTVIVTAPAGPMTVIEDLIKKLDANPVATADLRVFRLEHGDAFDVATMLESIFKPKDKDDSDSGFIRFLYFGDNPNARKAPKMTAVSDDRTNSVIVTAPTEMLTAIEGVIKKLDSNPAQQDSMFIYHLKNAQSDNLEWVLNTMFGNYQQNGQGQNQPFDPNAQQQQQNGRNNRQPANNNNRAAGNNRNNRANGRRGNFPRLPQGVANAVNELTGKVFVVADQDTNSLIVTTASKYEEQVRDIIDELDRPVPQVLIKVLVAEVTHTNSVDVGTDFSILNRRANGRGQTGGVNLGNADAGSGLVVSVLEEHVSATLHALAQDGRLEVLSRPYVLSSDNQVARISVGEEVARVTGSQTTDNGQTNTQFSYEDIGIILEVTPHINPDGLVILDVAPTVSQLTDRTVQVSEQLSVPVINKRTAESRVAVRSGDTIVIGGLMEDQKTKTVDKVPLLGDLPVFGPVFRRTRDSKRKTELLIFLTPHVAQQPEALKPMSEEETGATQLMPKAVGPGVFREHMRGMQRGRSSSATQPARPTTQVYRPGAAQRSAAPDTEPAEPIMPPPGAGPTSRPAPDPGLEPAGGGEAAGPGAP